MSPAYWLGIATIPALLVGGYLASWIVVRVVLALGHLSLGTIHRFNPSQSRTSREKRAAILYGLRRGVVFSKGEFVLIVGRGLDEDQRSWASGQLLRRIALADIIDGKGGES